MPKETFHELATPPEGRCCLQSLAVSGDGEFFAVHPVRMIERGRVILCRTCLGRLVSFAIAASHHAATREAGMKPGYGPRIVRPS